MRWAQRQRMNFIAERLMGFGHLRRGDLCARFEISIQRASQDLQLYMREHPGAMRYNLSSKRYERL